MAQRRHRDGVARAAAVAAAIVCSSVMAADAQDVPMPAGGAGAETVKRGEDLVRKLRAIDSVYRAGFTARGTEVVPYARDTKEKEPQRIPMRWGFTIKGDRWASVHDLPELRPPSFEGSDVIKFTRDGVAGDLLAQGVQTRVVTVFDLDLSAQFRSDQMFEKAPGGPPTRTKGRHSLMIFPPDRPDLRLPLMQTLWTAGRGFGEHLDEVESYEERPGGLIELRAKGHESPYVKGTWELVVDPAASYLVRSGRFIYTDEKEPTFTSENTGLKTAGTLTYPQSGTFTVTLAFGVHRVTEISFEAAELTFDEALYKDARAVAIEPYLPNTFVVDSRTNPVEPYRIDYNGKPLKPVPRGTTRLAGSRSAPAARQRPYWLLMGNVILLLGVLLLSWRTRRK